MIPKNVANEIKIRNHTMYRYEDQWKQALYKVEKATTDITVFEPLFEAAYQNIVGRKNF